MSSRRVLVVGSQCDALARLSFLPSLAGELYEVLTDPQLGACAPALPDGGVLHDPTLLELIDALERAFEAADADGAMLLVALVGHGIARGDDFYFLTRDASGLGRVNRDLHLSQHLKELLRGSVDLDGLVVLLDTCHSGAAAREAIEHWGKVGLGDQPRRYELLTASADEPAYGGQFTRTLIDAVRAGSTTAGQTLGAYDLRDPLLAGARAQHPQRVTVDGGGWAQSGDQGLWLAYNSAIRRDDDTAAARAARARAGELTGFLQPTPTLDALVSAADRYDCTVVTGPRGSGKSTLCAALCTPAATRGRVPTGFVHGVAFAARGSTLATLTATLVGQLTETVPGFAQAGHAFDATLDRAEREGLNALQRRVTGPLTRLRRGEPVRLVIDALDELPPTTQQAVRDALTAAQDGAGLATGQVRFVLTARPGTPRPAGAHHIDVEQPGEAVVEAYLLQRGVAAEHVPLLIDKAAGSWLHAYLLAERAVHPHFDPAQLPREVRPPLAQLYDGELLAAGAGDRERWESQLRPVLTVLAVAGAGPVLPIALAVAAAERLDGPSTPSQLRDALTRLSGLAVRAQPGRSTEHVGLFHVSLAEDYLLDPDETCQFPIDPAVGHRGIAEALQELAPPQMHDPTDLLHQYALRAEADHHWGCGDSTSVISSLLARPAARPGASLATAEQERWQRWAAVFASALPPGHTDRLAADYWSAYYTGATGNAAGALQAYQELLPVQERVSGPDHPDTLRVRAQIAYYTGATGNATGALQAYQELLSVQERVSGPDHPDTLVARAQIADWTGHAGDAAGALQAYHDLLPAWGRVFAFEHPNTLTARGQVAYWTGALGDAAGARQAYQNLLPVRIRVSGPEDPETLTLHAQIAYYAGAAGDAAGALQAYQNLLPVQERVSGPEHPDTLTVRGHIAYWTGEAGDAAGALCAYQDLLLVRERVLGPEHPDTLTARAQVAQYTGAAGDAAGALQAYQALLPVQERVSGLEHPDTLSVRAQIAYWTGEAGDPGGAGHT